jgi:hypothetical protein
MNEINEDFFHGLVFLHVLHQIGDFFLLHQMGDFFPGDFFRIPAEIPSVPFSFLTNISLCSGDLALEGYCPKYFKMVETY